MLDNQTNCVEILSENLDELDTKVKESIDLSKQFASLFSIFRSRKTHHIEHVTKEKNIMIKIKQKQNYEFKSEDPADEIAELLLERIKKFELIADGYKDRLIEKTPMLDAIADKVDKSNCDIKNVTNVIKKY